MYYPVWMSLLLLLLCRLLCGSEVSTDGCLTPLISLENERKTEEIKSEICGGGGTVCLGSLIQSACSAGVRFNQERKEEKYLCQVGQVGTHLIRLSDRKSIQWIWIFSILSVKGSWTEVNHFHSFWNASKWGENNHPTLQLLDWKHCELLRVFAIFYFLSFASNNVPVQTNWM